MALENGGTPGKDNPTPIKDSRFNEGVAQDLPSGQKVVDDRGVVDKVADWFNPETHGIVSYAKGAYNSYSDSERSEYMPSEILRQQFSGNSVTDHPQLLMQRVGATRDGIKGGEIKLYNGNALYYDGNTTSALTPDEKGIISAIAGIE